MSSTDEHDGGGALGWCSTSEAIEMFDDAGRGSRTINGGSGELGALNGWMLTNSVVRRGWLEYVDLVSFAAEDSFLQSCINLDGGIKDMRAKDF